MDKELLELLDGIYELPNSYQPCYETGSHEGNNRAGLRWYEKNKFLVDDIAKLIRFAESVDPRSKEV